MPESVPRSEAEVAPSSGPAALPLASPSIPQTQSLPPDAVAARAPTDEATPAAGPWDDSAEHKVAAARWPRALAVVALIIVLLVVAIAVVLAASGTLKLGAGAPASATATATRDITPGTTAYVAPGYFRIAVPAGWGNATLPTSAERLVNATFFDPAGNDKFVAEVVTASSVGNAQAADTDTLRQLSGSQGNLTPTSTTIVLAGATWLRETVDMHVLGIGPQHVVVLATVRNEFTYLLAYFTAADNAATADIAAFQPMLSSFTFLN